jgi:hypothetical protein
MTEAAVESSVEPAVSEVALVYNRWTLVRRGDLQDAEAGFRDVIRRFAQSFPVCENSTQIRAM